MSEIGFKSLFELDLTVISLSEGEKLNSLVFKSILQKGNLKQLTLKRCPNVCGALLDGLQSSLELKKLKWIKVGNGIKDEYYCNFLEKIGNQLTTLSLSGYSY